MEKIENGIDDVIGRYTYNADGIRYSKTAGGVTTKFYYNGITLTGEDRSDGKKLRYCYDQEGICGFRYYNGSEWKAYTYVKNLQGDVILIKDDMGAPKVKYEYDPWGNVTSVALNLDGGEPNPDEEELAKINPFRYRGYYYDEESKLYYLITRYYDPWVGQFISPDSFEYLDPGTIGGINLYAYCNYNPIMYRAEQIFNNYGAVSNILVNSTSGVDSLFINDWIKTIIGASPDIWTGVKYLKSTGIHTRFAYPTNTLYMFPIINSTWRRFAINNTSFTDLVGASFKQFLTGNARAGGVDLLKSFGKTALITAGINFAFNFFNYDWNSYNGDIYSAVLDIGLNTAIDTAIGMTSYYAAAGTMSLISAGALMLGVSIPGAVAVGGVILLSVGFDALIRWMFGYNN